MRFVKLKELCEFEKGFTGLAKAESGYYPLVTTGAERKSCNTYQFDAQAVCIPLVSSTGHGHASLKNVHYQEGKFALGSILVALTSKDDSRLDIQFLHLYLSQLKDQVLVPLMSGAANVALSVKKIQNIEIPLPTIQRQREIVERFKSIVIEEGEIKTELTHQQTLLKKLRQQILQEAIGGKLTADWRAQNPNVEPASELLKLIATEKAQLVKDKKIKAQKPLPRISNEEKPFELPQGWEWSRIGEITSVVTSGSRNWQSLYSDTGATFIRSQDIKLDRLCYANRVFVDIGKAKEGTRTLVNQHDWLIIITGANVGKCAYLHNPVEEAYVSQHVALMRPVLPEIGVFGHYWLVAELGGRGLLSKFIYGDKPGLNLPQIRNLLIPVAPLNEQQAIVSKIGKLLALCDQLETQITQNLTYAEQLMQAVLKEAFSHNSEAEPAAKYSKVNSNTPEIISA